LGKILLHGNDTRNVVYGALTDEKVLGGNVASPKELDFIWETTCEKLLRWHHNTTTVVNKLHNCHILESKSNLAFLQLLMKEENLKMSNSSLHIDLLDTYIAFSSTEVVQWFKAFWEFSHNDANSWWVVKASTGNGGRDVWIMNRSNWTEEIQQLPCDEEYVIQKYVMSPLLREGKKFHFRCYSLLLGDMTAWVYPQAFILTAGSDFDMTNADSTKHITNLSVNKQFKNHPGQIPCHLPAEYPAVIDSNEWH